MEPLIGSGFIGSKITLPKAKTPKAPDTALHKTVKPKADQFERMTFGSSKAKGLPVEIEYPPTPPWAVDIQHHTIPGIGPGYILSHSNGQTLFVSRGIDTATISQPPVRPPWAVGLTILTRHPTPPNELSYRFMNAQGTFLWVPLSHNADTATLGQPNTHTLIQAPPTFASAPSAFSVRPKTRPNTN